MIEHVPEMIEAGIDSFKIEGRKTDPQVLEKANPNIGVSVYREFLLSQQQRAKNNARLANVFKTKHLNIWVSARSAYFNLVSWHFGFKYVIKSEACLNTSFS